MADVKDHLDKVHEHLDILKTTVGLMRSSAQSSEFELGKHGAGLINLYAGMVNGSIKLLQEEIKDLDLAISIKGHKDK